MRLGRCASECLALHCILGPVHQEDVASCLFGRRWARPEQCGQHGLGSVPAIFVCPSRVTDVRAEAEVLLENHEERIFIETRVRAKGNQDVLETNRATTVSWY